MDETIGILEVSGFTPAIVALDEMTKTAAVRVLQAELNDFLGYVIKFTGSVADVAAALSAGVAAAEAMGGKPVSTVINRPAKEAWPAIDSRVEFNPLIQQNIVFTPSSAPSERTRKKEPAVAESSSFALGLIETQGFTAVFEAIDSACKAANVEVVGKEKLGGGYITVVIRGDVAAVKAAVDAGKAKVGSLGKLIAAHVIARPSEAVIGLLPKA